MNPLKKMIVINGIFGVIAVATSGLTLNKFLSYKSNLDSIINVEIGLLNYSNGKKLRSNDYKMCSALILDYNNEAIMAHALPTDNAPSWKLELGLLDTNYVFTHNVVKKSLREFKKKGISINNIEAIINAGEEKGLNRIIKDLNKNKIKIKSIKIEENKKLRSLMYNPVDNSLKIKHYNKVIE